ncbi:MAG: ParB N-terminal domain-containing protein [Candidatus Sphingomonas colombiensis]|nr:DUF6551 family protein [Sphingomonas sp.]WEK43618.1 MAG: ParB N-terminal domain-containing protein [Sphingomonas sp.]
MKLQPQRGTLPVLQYCPPVQLGIDPLYQRQLDQRSHQLIARIAAGWDWNLFQPLVVARRPDGALFVVDGQHRLAAAKARGDIQQLPCVIFASAAPAEEADVFVKLNQERRPLTAFALYNAAIATGDPAVIALDAIIRETGWRFVGGADTKALKPGELNIVGRVRRWHTRYGDRLTRTALNILARAFRGQQLQHPGYMFVAIFTIAAEHGENFSSHLLVDLLDRPQDEWHGDFHQRAAADGTGIEAAAIAVLGDAYREAIAELDGETPDAEPREPASPRARECGRAGGVTLVNGNSRGRQRGGVSAVQPSDRG